MKSINTQCSVETAKNGARYVEIPVSLGAKIGDEVFDVIEERVYDRKNRFDRNAYTTQNVRRSLVISGFGKSYISEFSGVEVVRAYGEKYSFGEKI